MQIAQEMLNQSLGDKLRKLIQDDRTHDNVSYYARFFSDADYGTTHLAVLAKNGDAVSLTSTINYRLVKEKGGNELCLLIKALLAPLQSYGCHFAFAKFNKS